MAAHSDAAALGEIGRAIEDRVAPYISDVLVLLEYWDNPQNGLEHLFQRRIGNLDGHACVDYRASSDGPVWSGSSLSGPVIRVTTSFIV